MPEPGATFRLNFQDMASGQFIRAQEAMKRIASGAGYEIKKSTKAATIAIDEQARSMKQAKDRAFEYSEESGRMRGVTSGLRRELGALRNQLLLIAFAYQTIRRVIIPVIELAMKQEDAERRLHFLMVEKARLTEQDYQNSLKQAKALQQLTGYGDEQILVVQGTLAIMKQLTSEQRERAIPLILDLARSYELSTGRSADLERITKAVSRAMKGTVDSLIEMGINLGRTKRGALDVDDVLKLLESRVGGLAQRNETLSDTLRRLRSSWGDLGETIGILALPALKGAADRLKDISDYLQSFQKQAVPWQRQLRWDLMAAAGLIDLVMKEMEEFYKTVELAPIHIIPPPTPEDFAMWEAFGDHLEKIMKEAASKMADSLSTLFFDVVTGQLKSMKDYFIDFGRTVLKIMTDYLAKLLLAKTIFAAMGWTVPTGWPGAIEKHQGGMIKRYQYGGVVPALLEPGEGVVSRRGMAALGEEGLNRLNRGEGARGDTYVIINAIDTKSFRERLAENSDLFSSSVYGDIEGNTPIRDIIRTLGT